MTVSATVKVIAIRSLRTFVQGGAHPGEMLGPHLWSGSVQMSGRHADWPAALDYSEQQGWVEKLPDDQYRLTDSGFACMSVDDILYGPVHANGTPEQQDDMHIAIETSGGDEQKAKGEFCEEQGRQGKDIPANVDAIYDWCKAHSLP